MTKQRDIVFDALKLFAIFLVLWGHSIQYFVSSEYYDEPVYRIIYSFHMPLFMVIVGYFSNSILTLPIKSMIVKKGRQLILPAISFGIPFFLLGILRAGGGFKEGLLNWIYCFWFVKSAFFCCLLFFIAYRCFPQKWIGITISLCLSQLVTIYQLNFMYPCFLFGLLINHNFALIKRNSLIITLSSGLIFLSLLLFWDARFWKIPQVQPFLPVFQGSGLGFDYVYKFSYKICIGLAGSLFFIALFEYLSTVLKGSRFTNAISRFGSETLGIYLLQTFVIELLLHKYLNFDSFGFFSFNFIIAPAVSLIVLLLCLYIIYLIKKSPLFSFMLLGKSYHRANHS